MLLAKQGLDVTVLERAPGVGGRTASIEEQGFTFDTGPTFFLYPQVLEEVFNHCGRNLHDEIKLIQLDPQYRIIFGGGGQIRATGDVERMEREIATISPKDAPAFRRFMEDNRKKLKLFDPCLRSPFHGLSDVLNLHILKLLPMLRPHKSLEEDLASFYTDPRIRLAFSFQSKYLGMSPFNCPSLFSILSFLEYEHGVFHPAGGCNAITKAMARVARELGARIELDADVTEILFDGKRATGVRTSQGEHRAGALIINADFGRAMTRLVPDRLRKRWTDARLARKRYSCSAFMLYLGVEGRYDNLDHHNIFITNDYRSNLDEIENKHVLSGDPSFYVQNACVTDPSLAPAGMSTLYVLVPVTHQHPNVDWTKESESFRALTLRQLRKIGIDDVEKRIRFERMITPANWEKEFEIYRGATFNLSHNLGQMLHLRPRNRFDELEGVYLVGGGTHPGSGLPVIFQSALITARVLCEDLGISAAT
jgi:phytoene desaturase